jgi:hypothetical protein
MSAYFELLQILLNIKVKQEKTKRQPRYLRHVLTTSLIWATTRGVWATQVDVQATPGGVQVTPKGVWAIPRGVYRWF